MQKVWNSYTTQRSPNQSSSLFSSFLLASRSASLESYPNRLAGFGVLAYTTVTNYGSSVIRADIGLYSGTSITGFPPGFPPGVINGVFETTTPKAQLAKRDLETIRNNWVGQVYMGLKKRDPV